MFWQKECETRSRVEIERIQLENLKAVVSRCYNNVEYYQKKLDAAGVTPEKIKTLSDIEYIPYTTKDDLRDTYPYGMFAEPLRKVVRVHASSGTTGKPTVVGYTKNDLELWTNLVARLVVAAGATEDDIAQIAFGYGLFTGALGLHYGLERLGAMVVPTSSGNTEKNIMLMKDFGATTLISTPSYAMYMSEVAQELGYNKNNFSLRLGLFGSEGSTVEMRNKLDEVWGIFSTDNYGISELMGPGVAGECTERDGMHIAEDHFLAELIDSKTEQPLGMAAQQNGESGELVVTTLTKEAFPLLRYRTKDITRLNYEPCRCGRTLVRMDKIMGRSDDMLKIRGVNVFPTQIESVLIGMKHITPNYQLVVRRKGYMDTLEVKVELSDSGLLERYAELETLQETVRGRLKSVLGIDAKINLVENKSLERFIGKAKRIVDLRDQKDEQ